MGWRVRLEAPRKGRGGVGDASSPSALLTSPEGPAEVAAHERGEERRRVRAANKRTHLVRSLSALLCPRRSGLIAAGALLRLRSRGIALPFILVIALPIPATSLLARPTTHAILGFKTCPTKEFRSCR
jgi:hypothetical protein